MDEGLAPLNQLKDGLAGIEDEISQCDSGIAELQKQINDGDTLYQEYTKISEPDRTPEQRVYLESWSGVRQGLEAKLAGIQEQKAQLEDKRRLASADESGRFCHRSRPGSTDYQPD